MSKIYHIPVNFNQSGYVFNGLIETRKAVEAVGGVLLGYLICKLLPLPSGLVSISIYVFVCLLMGMIGFVGIRGEPISSYLIYRHKWKKIRKKPFIYNPNGEVFAMPTAQVILDEPAIQDALADAWENFTAKFQQKQSDYVLGETFRFAEDPMIARMKNAQEQQSKPQEVPEETIDTTASAELDMDELLMPTKTRKGGMRREKKK